MLTGIDVLNIARAKNVPTATVLEKYTRRYIGKDSGLPIVVLKEREYDGSCPMLRNGKCEIHELKPMVCKLFPLGRYFDPRTEEIHYFENPVAGCWGDNDTDRTWTLEEWLTLFHVTEYDDDSHAWNMAITSLSEVLRKETNPDAKQKLVNMAAMILYIGIDYQSPHPYCKQLLNNMRKVAL